MNAAYRQAVPKDTAKTTPSNKHLMQHNLAYGSQNQMSEGTESGSTGDYERMSDYVALHHGNPTHREEGTCSHLALPMVYVMPVQQGQSNTHTGEYDDEHCYEYIR